MTIELKFGTTSGRLDPTSPRLLLGRDEQSCNLWNHDASVSRRHAEVFLEGSNVYIRDLGSSNGTWVDGSALGPHPVQLRPGQIVYVGHAPLGVEWAQAGGGRAGTVIAALPPELMALMAQRQQQMAAGQLPGQPMGYAPQPMGYAPQPMGYAAQPGQPMGYAPQPMGYAAQPGQPMGYAPPQPAPTPSQAPMQGSPAAYAAAQSMSNAAVGVAATVGIGGTVAPLPSELTYRRQGGNDNGTLLIALPGDTFANDSTIDGFLEFTATDNETVVSVFIELIEYHKKGHKNGHVWDRCLVRQGPWKTKKGDVLPMPFQLRVPSGTSVSSPICHWELRGYVDINWASDIEAKIPITMRNRDIEKLRDALGALDYRIADLESRPLGQKYIGKFNPPLHLAKQLNITDINLDIEYLGTNVKVVMEVEKNKLFHFDKRQEFVFALDMLRKASLQDVSMHFQQEINKLMR